MADQADQFKQGESIRNQEDITHLRGKLTVTYRPQHSCDQTELPWKGV